jgi:Rrf2 family protein
MILSKKSRYGLRTLIDLAVSSKTEPTALSSIAEKNEISPQYLEQVFASLRRAGIVRSIKGSQGGYFLNRELNDITVAEILEVLDGSYWIEEEVANEDSNYRGISITIQSMVIDQINKKLDSVLKSLTLADLVQEYLDSGVDGQNMYYI